MHDYLFGMISLRSRGENLPSLAGRIIGKPFKHVVNAFSLLLLLLVGTVFVATPASILYNLTGDWLSKEVIVLIIFVYYFLSTILSFDKIIGKIYPYFGALLIISAIALIIGLFIKGYSIPELTLYNMHPAHLPIYPLLFLTISCGAVSGFHCTQAPMIARTLMKESDGRTVFFGAMFAEALIALIWAVVAMSIFPGGLEELASIIKTGTPALVVNKAAFLLLGGFLGTLTVIGMVILPITSGDTAFRAFRLIFAEYIHLPQKRILNRFKITIPIFVIAALLTQVDFGIIWRFFSWANQSLAALTLWVITIYLLRKQRNYALPLLGALFLTHAIVTYIFFDPTFMIQLPLGTSSYIAGGIVGTILVSFFIFIVSKKKEGIDIA